MDSRDEKLTLENVDEQVEEYLSLSQEPQSLTEASLARMVHNLQSIYEEEHRLEDVWARINSRVSALSSERADGLAGREQAQAPTFLARERADGLAGGEQAQAPILLTREQADGPFGRGQAHVPTLLRGPDKQPRLPFRRGWYKLAIGLVAAIILVAFCIWPIVSYAFQALQTTRPQPSVKTITPHIQSTVNVPKQTQTQNGTKIGSTTVTSTVTPTSTPIATSSPIATPTPSPTTSVPSLKVYSNQYFTIQYPTDWVITSVTTGGSYQQTVQFRPSDTSSALFEVDVMYSTSLSSDLLLLADTDVKQGTLLSTSTVTYNGIPWATGIVSTQAQSSEEEIAYSNQKAPYRIKFAAPPDMFSSYTDVFDAMFASFYPTG
jgi:hypothetical protein